MKPILLITLLFMTCCIAFGAGSGVPPRGWEQVRTEIQDETKTVAKEAELEVKVSPGFIIVSASSPVQIKVFTILGRLVSEENLPAGISRLQLPAHGVYIIKAGSLTCKVAV
ncbi:MAG: T9SS type A sorting domain-containing protein [Muribaculaceae bacterium]|nr:T9SS type A sorting domain-containing protein [Muribaculaceae bacterium]